MMELLKGNDVKIKDPENCYFLCLLCGGDKYDPCEHLLKMLEEDSMADKDITQPVQVHDSATPIKNPENDFRKQGNTAQEAINNRVQQRKGINPSEK